MTIERRVIGGPVAVETREDGARVVSGLAAVYWRSDAPGSEYRLDDGYVERIAPGAFTDAIGQDVRGLVNHDPNLLVGRTAAQTMRLVDTADGLRYEIDVPDTQAGRDLLTLVERGDMTGASFSFVLGKGGARYAREGDTVVRTITRVDRLFDVGPVTFPAYEGSTASARDAEGAMADLAAFRAAEESDSEPAADDRARLDLRAAEMRMLIA